MTPLSPLRRVLQLPIAWLIVGMIAVGGAYALIISPAAVAGPVGTVMLPLIGVIVGLLIYRFVMRRLAGRAVPELSRTRSLFETVFGIEVGLVFIAVSVATIALLGGYSFEWAPTDALAVITTVVVANIGAAVIEELVFRGLALQALEKLGGSWAALAGTSLLFGIMHLANPGATLWSAFAIALEAGVLLGSAFLWRRSLWFAIGLHFAWNTTEGLLGIPISGIASPGLFTVTVNGSPLLTGGAFGLEASIVPVAVSVLLSIPMLVLAHRRGNIVLRSPARRQTTAIVGS
ncbi:CPBP family intramembrane glutamic endopeptidase [Microbacterium sp. MPKO10]|uniref:CPBP family intramembrane glutamic endopeptidase n=1 Tax=Microbacterium sp. MPKO10 TaxID=2989818 RepID=UPI002236881E|nr:type II CAAX endopeptidase family protein [Microbacterium sp. MPKO10]MCW4457729.1 CPBP family intramembrane metalloprotease [Microbacterium sp. MPKO10]